MNAPGARARSEAWLACAAAVAVLAAFWVPAWLRGAAPPAPLDDVFIHFGFARSLAHGRPMEWIAGNGYASGATSVTYPVVLAPAFWLGLDGAPIGWVAAVIAVVAVADLLRSIARLLDRAPAWARLGAPLLAIAVPFVDWSLASGMETAFLAAVLGRALLAVRAVERAPADRRANAQVRAGLWLALLVATRPETLALALPLAVAVTHAAGTLGAARSIVCALGPTALFLGAQALANFTFTGEIAAAGAVRKLVTTNPYASPPEIAIEVVKNAAALRQQIGVALGPGPLAYALPALAVVASFARSTRRLAIPLTIGAFGALALVCFNATARFQNLRYAAPSVLMLAAAAALGVGALARRSRSIRFLAVAALALSLVGPAAAFPRQIDHFARASIDIRDQQLEVARRLAERSPRPRRVFVNDAGAIPYASGLPAIDGLGLGGFRGLPFARASVHGVPAVLELLERLDPADRPDVLAIYPGWWPGLADGFGHRAFAVQIADNVICGGDEKVVFDADWSAFASPGEDAPPGVVDELDVADLVDERAHGYAFDAPHGGYAIGAVLDERGRARWDGGRLIPEGLSESFTVHAEMPRGPATLVLRTDPGDAGEIVVAVGEASSVRVFVPRREPGRWHRVPVALDAVGGGDRVTLRATRLPFRDFHAWITRP